MPLLAATLALACSRGQPAASDPGASPPAPVASPSLPATPLPTPPPPPDDPPPDDHLLRLQVLLDRAHFSPGVIDGRDGANTRQALRMYRQERGKRNGEWAGLEADTAPHLVEYTITAQDLAGPFLPEIPDDMMKKAELERLVYTSPLEALAEKFHATPALLQHLNPQATFARAGERIRVPNVATSAPGDAARVVISKSGPWVAAVDGQGRMMTFYPATIGSRYDPLPAGETWEIKGVSRDPVFHYNPDLFWDAKASHAKAEIPPGPNNPVGVVWIDLSKPHYGIHGTPEPSTIGKTESHGCIRLTNWDADELAGMVKPGLPVPIRR